MITQQELKEKLDYNQETGIFTRKISNNIKIKVGDIAGILHNSGYINIQINCKKYYAHRLAWLYVYGSLPKGQIDHINGIKTDNRIENLRDVTHSHNQQNTYKHRNGKLIGASYHKQHKKWLSFITINGRMKTIGYFNTEEQAHDAYLKELKTCEF